MRYLLDTNILSTLAKNPRGQLAARISELPHDSALTSIIVVGELRYGLAKLPSRSRERQLRAILRPILIADIEAPCDVIYGEIRSQLERAGTPIGANDLWIAAHALALDCTLITANEREFRRVPGLQVENWHESPEG